MRFVLDANVALTWLIGGTLEQQAYADAVAGHLESRNALCVVPEIWHLEVGHNLIKARRTPSMKFGAAKLKAALAEINRLPIEPTMWPSRRLKSSSWRLATMCRATMRCTLIWPAASSYPWRRWMAG